MSVPMRRRGGTGEDLTIDTNIENNYSNAEMSVTTTIPASINYQNDMMEEDGDEATSKSNILSIGGSPAFGSGSPLITPMNGVNTLLSPNTVRSNFSQSTTALDSTKSAQSLSPSRESSVQVAVRVRPLLGIEAGNNRCVDVLSSGQRLKRRKETDQGSNTTPTHINDMIRIGGEGGKSFTFDLAFDHLTNQRSFFNHAVVPLVEACLDGYNATILAYGQTGSGKTFTILGPSNAASFDDEIDQDDENLNKGMPSSQSKAGVIPRALRDLFTRLNSLRSSHCNPNIDKDDDDNDNDDTDKKHNASHDDDMNEHSEHDMNDDHRPYQYEVRVQFLELYGEDIRDLLSSSPHKKLSIRDGGQGMEPEVIGASEVRVYSAEEALLCLTRGMLRRVTASTAMNTESSRSHAIMTVVVEQNLDNSLRDTYEQRNNTGNGEVIETKRSKIHFVDLAGSERQKRSQAEGKRLKEGIDINKGLLVLGNVISALGDPKKRGKTFVPYRDSKLTRLLKGSLGGNHKTLMIACVSPSSSNLEESLNCLRYANRARNIQNNATINMDAASRMVAELRLQVQALAVELLKEISINQQAKYGENNDSENKISNGTTTPQTIGPFTIEMLHGLASGNTSAGTNLVLHPSMAIMPPPPPPAIPASPPNAKADNIATTNSLRDSLTNHAAALSNNDVGDEIEVASAEINQLKNKLKAMKDDLYSTSEELFAAKAEKEFYRIKNEAIFSQADHDQTQVAVKEEKNGIDPTTSLGDIMSSAPYIDKMKNYEREIASLKNKLQDAKAAASINVSRNTISDGDSKEDYNIISDGGNEADLDDTNFQEKRRDPPSIMGDSFNNSVIARASEVLEMEKSRLKELKKSRRKTDRKMTSVEKEEDGIEIELIVEEREGGKLTEKYIQISNGSDYDIDGDYDVATESKENVEDITEEDNHEDLYSQRQQHLDAHLFDLSKNIAAKEELINHLHRSQSKYETMRQFYEDKLKEMETQLCDRESEREQLADELKTYKKDSQKFKEVQDLLSKKEDHIANLRKKQQDLANLTQVSTRNEGVLTRLRSDIVEMKRQKVELQRQVTKERKSHTTMMNALRKDKLQTEKDGEKIRKELVKSLAEKENLKKVAKANAEEVSKLRSKYRDAEKQLRMQTLKRGVMERVGIDSVMVGRKDLGKKDGFTKGRQSMSPGIKDKNDKINATTDSDVDINRVRGFLEAKVSEISRKEASADKLAHEWEDHLELVSRKEQLLKDESENDKESVSDDLEALDIQIKYKEKRIRDLTRRLGERPKSMQKGLTNKNFIFQENELKELCGQMTALSASNLTSKVLFGMVVRERRRVAALARTASSLDQKAIEAENLAVSKETALRSYMDDERHERAAMAQSQQEQILSLMALVQQEEEELFNAGPASSSLTGKLSSPDKEEFQSLLPAQRPRSSDSMVLRLANERIDVLERQLSELQGEKSAKEMYKAKMAETSHELTLKINECNDLHTELRAMKSSLRKAREAILGVNISSSSLKNRGEHNLDEMNNVDKSEEVPKIESFYQNEAIRILQNALHPKDSQSKKSSPVKQIRFASSTIISPGMKPNIDHLSSSDSEDAEVSPEWAGDIMKDLEIIASGNVPPSMKVTNKRASNSKKVIRKGNVFDRLTDPSNFTGTQKNSYMTTNEKNSDQISLSGLSNSSRKSKTNSSKIARSLPPRGSPRTPRQKRNDLPPLVVSMPKKSVNNSSSNSVGSTGSYESLHSVPVTKPRKSIFRSVYERLQSPTNYTGTQKAVHSAIKGQKQRKNLFKETKSQEPSPDKSKKDANPTPVDDFVQKYTEQDVFDRLHKKVTNSYALKHQTGADVEAEI